MERSKRNFPDFTVVLKFRLCCQQSPWGTPTSFSGTEFGNFKGREGAGGWIPRGQGTSVTPAVAFQASASCALPQRSVSIRPRDRLPLHSPLRQPATLGSCSQDVSPGSYGSSEIKPLQDRGTFAQICTSWPQRKAVSALTWIRGLKTQSLPHGYRIPS